MCLVQMREAKSASDKVQKDYNLMCEKVQKLHQDLEAQVSPGTYV